MAIMSSTTTSTLTVKSATAIATGELEQIQEWNSRIELESVERCVHDVIAEKTQTAPSAEAIAAWDGTLTYSQLDALSTALASRLVELGHSREKFIGLLFDKSKWTSVSVLAVMKAGAAFFLIDSSLPDQRIRRMCEIAQASAVITSPSLSTRAGQFERPILVAEHESQRTVTTLVSLPTVSPRDALYVAFTSGSTGDPKCVVNTHTAATSGIQPYSRRMGLTQQSRMFQLSSYSFVICILDHLGALMNGACLCVPSTEQVQNSLARAITELNANWVELTPSVARGLEPREVQTLRTVVLVGEATTLSDLDTWRGSVDLKTCYGQTENCLGALIDDKTETSSPSDMGYPWAAHCWVVNPNSDDLVPIGAEGELWLEGPSLARGYFNNAEQTAAVFIENPTWMQKIRPGERARFLRTGDLVRYRPGSGMLQYVGRGGTQVKLRGQRIELADVESHLKKQFPEADATIAEVVNPSQDANGALLVAFIMVGHAKASGDAATDAPLFADTTAEFSAQSQNALAQLQDTLPKYMVPTTVVPLAARPLTASGKLDRKLLRSKACELGLKLQTYHLITETKAHRPARTENEVVIRDMCAGLLRSAIEDVNMDASFFELGGNSISAMWLVSRAREAGFAFTSANVFQQMSLAELAGKYGGVGSARDTGAETASELPLTAAQKEELTKFIPPDIDPSNVSDFFPCSHEQQWQVSNQKDGAFLFRFSGPLQVDRLQTACRRLVQTHSSLRSLFTLHDGRFMQVILKDIDDFPFTIRHSNSPTQDPLSFAKDLCAAEPAVDPHVLPLQFTLIPGSSGQEHVLILYLSHGQYDGICQQTLISDLCALYQNPSDPGVVPTNFAHYARHLARQQTPDESAFWKKLLEGSNITRLPTPLQNPSQKAIPLHCATTIPIPDKPLPTGVTLATVVKAAWPQVLRKATGSQDIVFAQYVALRDLESVPQAHRLVGFCVNSCPVRVDFNGGSGSNNKPIKTALDLLHALKTQHTQTIPFKASQWDYTVSNSTDWPRGSEAQSTYIDVNFDIEKAFDLGGGLRCELVDYLGIFPPLDAMRVTSGPRGDKELKIELTSSTTIVEGDRLEFLLGELSRTVADFMASPERPLDGI